MAVQRKLADVHRRLKRLNRKNNRRRKAKQNSHNYESLELRRLLSVNAAPVGLNDNLYSTPVDAELNVDDVQNGLLANDFDVDVEFEGLQSLTATNLPTTTAEGGALTANANGTFAYSPPTGFEGFDSFTYQVFDGNAHSEETLVSISVGQSLSAQLNESELIGGNVLHTGSLETTQSLGSGLELVYRSDSTPTAIVAVETRLLSGATTPDSISVSTVLGGVPSGVTTFNIDGSFDPTEAFRFVQGVDASSLSTGQYDWTMSVTLHRSGSPDELHQFTGEQAIVNRTSSEFGSGWWLSGLDRLHATVGEGVLLENSDGTTFYFKENGSGFDRAVGDQTFSVLSQSGGVYTLTDNWGDSRTFDSSGRITSVQRLNSSTADFSYSYIGGQLDKITDISGREYSFTYDANNHLASVVDFANRHTNLTILSDGRLTIVTVADEPADPGNYPNYIGPEWVYTYQQIDGQDYLQSVVDPADAITNFQFDPETHRLSKIVNADASEWELFPSLTQGFTGPGAKTLFQADEVDARTIDERGETFRFQTGGFGNLTSLTDAELAVSTFQFDQHGQLIRSTGADPDGAAGNEYESSITRFGYSELGDLVLVVNPDDTTQERTYDGFHNVATSTNELGDVEIFVRDAANGNLLRYEDGAVDSGGQRFGINYVYDAYGNLIEENSDDPDGLSGPLTSLVTTYNYDDPVVVDRLTSIQVNNDPATTFTYTNSDQIKTVTDPLGRTTTNAFDPFDRLVNTVLPDPDDIGGTNGPLLSPVYLYTYGDNLLIESETDPLGNVTTYGYDADRQFLTSVTLPDPDGPTGSLTAPVAQYEYYDNGLLHKEFLPEFAGTTHIEYIYDGDGRLISEIGPIAGQVTNYVYDAAGRLETETDVFGRTITYKYDINNRLTSVVDHDPDGAGPLDSPTTSYEYDLAGRVNRVIDPLGRFTAWSYLANGLLEKSYIQNPNPEATEGLFGTSSFTTTDNMTFDDLQATVYAYDALNRLVSSTDPTNRVTTNVYNDRGQITSRIAPDPNQDDLILEEPTTVYAFDEVDRLLSVTDVLGRITTFEYDNLDRRTKTILPDPDDDLNGNNGPLVSPEFRYEYDAVGNLTKTIDSLDREFITVYDNLYRTIESTEYSAASGNKRKGPYSPAYIANWEFVYNDQMQIAEIIDPEGASTERLYDGAGRLTTELDSFDNATTYTYDLLDRIDTVTAPDPDGTPGGLESLVTDYGYDILSRIVSVDGVNGLTLQEFNAAGELISLTDELENTTRFAYDLLGRQTLETDALGHSTSNLYNIRGRLVRQADRNGDVTWFGVEGYSETEYWFKYTVQAPAPTISVTTDTEGGSGFDEVQTVTVNTDGAFRLAFGGEVTLFIDVGSTATDVEAALESLHSVDDVTVTKINDQYTVTFVGVHTDTDVDQLIGDVVALSDGDATREIQSDYDAVGNLLGVTDFIDGLIPGSADYTYTYDQLDRRITQNEVIVGLTPEIDLTFEYDIVNRRTLLSATIGSNADYQNSNDYDHQDRPKWVRQESQAGGNVVAYKRVEFRYNEISQPTYINRFESATTQNGTASLRTVFNYDDDNRLESLSHNAAHFQQSAPILHVYDFVYDEASRIQSIDSSLDGLTNYTFGTTNQLTDADHDVNNESTGTDPDETYVYDANGNRITSGYAVSAQNRTQSDGTYNYEYDSEGNRTKRTLIADDSYEVNTFDHRNRLTSVEFFTAAGVSVQTIAYTYDAFNNLVRRTVDSSTDQFFAGLDGDQSSLEFDGPNDTDLTHRRLWGPFVDQLIASEDVDSLTQAGDVLWPLTDQTGTIRDIAELDSTSTSFEIVSHRVYNSFGLQTDEYDPDTGTASGIELDFGFTGKFTDELTGLTHHQNRWFDPAIGKWISEDPIGFAGGDVNTTRYVSNNPLMYTDPTGLFASSSNFGDLNEGGGDTGGGDGVRAYEPPDEEERPPFPIRFAHWLLGTTPDSIKSKNRQDRGRFVEQHSQPKGDKIVDTCGDQRALGASALNAELMGQLAETAVNHNAGAGFAATAGCGGVLTQAGKRRFARDLGNIPRTSQPIRQGRYKGTKWWEYDDIKGNRKIVVEHTDGSVHVGRPKPQSEHLNGKPPKYYPEPGTGHVGDD